MLQGIHRFRLKRVSNEVVKCNVLVREEEVRRFPFWHIELVKFREAYCEDGVTECKVCYALKQVGLNKLPGLGGLPYEVYFRLLQMFVPILMDMFNHWFAPGAISGSVTKGMITLLKKYGRHVWEDLNDYRPINLLNTELKI